MAPPHRELEQQCVAGKLEQISPGFGDDLDHFRKIRVEHLEQRPGPFLPHTGYYFAHCFGGFTGNCNFPLFQPVKKSGLVLFVKYANHFVPLTLVAGRS